MERERERGREASVSVCHHSLELCHSNSSTLGLCGPVGVAHLVWPS